MGHNGSPYDYVIHAALILRSRVANYQLPTSSDIEQLLRKKSTNISQKFYSFVAVQVNDVMRNA